MFYEKYVRGRSVVSGGFACFSKSVSLARDRGDSFYGKPERQIFGDMDEWRYFSW